jgi:nucleoid DNA-binding protein
MSTKLDLATKIAKRTGIEQQAVKQVVQMTLDGIIDVLANSGRRLSGDSHRLFLTDRAG